MSLEIKWPPSAPGERFLSYKIYPLLICYWEYAYILRVGRGEIFCWEDFTRGEISMEREVSRGVNFSGEILHLVNLPEFLYEISLYVLLFLYRFNFRRGDVKGNCPG